MLTRQEINSRRLIIFDALEALVIENVRTITPDSLEAIEAIALQYKLYQDACKAIKLALVDADD